METTNETENLNNEESVRIRTELFNRHVYPHRNLIFKLCIRYTYSPADIEDNYNEVLINFFKYIETYDPARSIQTWLHIVTKRFIADLTTRRNARHKTTDDVDVTRLADGMPDEDEVSSNCMGMDNYAEMYNDDILEALSEIKPIYREALLLQQAGYKLSEIMEICYKKGNLKTKNIETIKSRIFLAKQQIRKLIDRNGEKRIDQV
ncbi:RNA polymerase sigma factor [Dysgonomonas sp. ZJ279]|uniref:RNA polymerase sigma factor n=1 Tax=Dysgonomonas sp. ZJ279 TaxID=2709796 RepID=UPI0013EC1E77|nr:RNA polymerase sigma factor [Dysgonomonas sp. ZJ279]